MSVDHGPRSRSETGTSVLSAIGGTPLVDLERVTRGLIGRILAKLEYLNPSGSKKDRIALRMIEDAERSGDLRPEQTVVELTSGNTGTGGDVNVFCELVGTGGTFAGIATFLKANDASIACYVVEPAGAAVMAGQHLDRPGHRIQGGGYAKPALPLLDPALIDGYVEVSDEEAIDGARRLAREEGIFGGFSCGACLVAAERLLRDRHPGQTIAIVIADSGMKYLSTDLWSAD